MESIEYGKWVITLGNLVHYIFDTETEAWAHRRLLETFSSMEYSDPQQVISPEEFARNDGKFSKVNSDY